MKTKSNAIIMQNKVFLWIALATGLILMIPLIAMQITNEVNWTLSDFTVIGSFSLVLVPYLSWLRGLRHPGIELS